MPATTMAPSTASHTRRAVRGRRNGARLRSIRSLDRSGGGVSVIGGMKMKPPPGERAAEPSFYLCREGDEIASPSALRARADGGDHGRRRRLAVAPTQKQGHR